MTKSIVNKTLKALRVPLPRGKTLHLGPRKTGRISAHDVDHPPFQKMVEAGDVEILDEAENEAVPTPGRRGESPFEQ